MDGSLAKWPISDEREVELLREVLESGQWGGFHPMVARFEEAFAQWQHCRYGLAAANGTLTLEAALTVAGVGPGDEVIVPAISFISTATAVSRVGATPVFVDIDPKTFNMDAAAAGAAVSDRTRAIVVVHFGGPMADMDRFSELAAARGVMLIEDAAHAHGSEWRGRRAGSFGLCGSFSFQNGKVMTAGEGGILTTNDEDFARDARQLINQGRRVGENFFFHFTLGTNFRMTALQAAVLVAQLERAPQQAALRERNCGWLRARLAGIEGLTFQRVPPEATANSNYLLIGTIDESRFGMSRDGFQRTLTEAGFPCTPFYPHTLYQNPMYRAGGCKVCPCPVSEQRVRDGFWLPHRVLMSDQALLERLAATVARAHAAGG
jgi:dTDP-4-amino-4,6-dideoxygalactose transaminase